MSDDAKVSGGGDGCASGCLTLFYTPGLVLAMIISWDLNHSVLWAVLHGWASWGYIIYWAYFR